MLGIPPISEMGNGIFKGGFIDRGMDQKYRLLDSHHRGQPGDYRSLDHTQSASRRPSNAAWRRQPRRDKNQEARQALHGTPTPRAEPTPHSLSLKSPVAFKWQKSRGIFIIAFAKQTLPYLKQRSKARQSPRCKQQLEGSPRPPRKVWANDYPDGFLRSSRQAAQ